jgi:HEAT repeat protein
VAAAVCTASHAQDVKFLNKDPVYWMNELRSTKPAARRAAAFALGKLGIAAWRYQGVRPLVEHLTDQEKDTGVRDAAAFALGEIGLGLRKYPRELGKQREMIWQAAAPTVLKALAEDESPQVRRSAAYAVGGFGAGSETAREALYTALADKSSGVRQNAAWALGQLDKAEGRQTVVRLCQVLSDDDAMVRRDAAGAIGEIGRLRDPSGRPAASPGVRPLIERLRSDRDVTVRKVALDSLVNVITPEDRPVAAELRTFLNSPDPEIARGAAFALGNIGGTEAAAALPVLRKALREPDTSVRVQASAAVVNLGEEALPALFDLIGALDDKEPEVRRCAALALGGIGPKAQAAIPALARHLRPEETNAEVRKFAAEALAQMGEAIEPAVPALLRAIREDKVPPVRQRSAFALLQVRDLEASKAVDTLAAVLEETDDEGAMVRYDAARVLAERLQGRAPARTVDVLLQMLNDKRIRIYKGSGTDVTGSSVEGSGGKATVAANLGGDARYLAAYCLRLIGPPKANRPDVIRALEEAAKSSDTETRNEALKALRIVRGNRR